MLLLLSQDCHPELVSGSILDADPETSGHHDRIGIYELIKLDVSFRLLVPNTRE